jgi:hypothetical protein
MELSYEVNMSYELNYNQFLKLFKDFELRD